MLPQDPILTAFVFPLWVGWDVQGSTSRDASSSGFSLALGFSQIKVWIICKYCSLYLWQLSSSSSCIEPKLWLPLQSDSICFPSFSPLKVSPITSSGALYFLFLYGIRDWKLQDALFTSLKWEASLYYCYFLEVHWSFVCGLICIL